MEALKKGQQLQSEESGSPPILKQSHSNKKRERQSQKQWIFVGTGLVFLSVGLLILIKPGSPPMATQFNQTQVLMDHKFSAPAIDKISTEFPKEISISLKEAESTSSAQPLDHTSSRYTSHHSDSGKVGEEGFSFSRKEVREQTSLVSKRAMNKNNIELPIAQSSEKERLEPYGKVLEEKNPPPSPIQKEASLSKSIEVEEKQGKDRPLVTEILHHFNSGVALYHQKEFSKAIQAYQKVIQLDPAHVEAYNNLGIIYQALGEMERAFEAFQKSIEINPKYEKGYNNLGILLFLKGRYEQAQEVFEKGLAINPNNVDSYLHLGILFKKKGEWEKAIESYQKALGIQPLHSETHYNIALLYEQLENPEMAITHYQQFIRLSSKSYPELVLKVQRHLDTLVRIKGNRK